MEGIQSFEQRTSSEAAYEIDSKRNRIILANRREPTCAWSTVNQPISQSGGCCCNGHTNATEPTGPINQQRAAQPSCLSRCFGWLSCCWSSSSTGLYRASQHLKSNSSLLSISMQHIDAGPFSSNEWRTSKYTLLNFLPKNLFEQFRRFANFYFLTTAILQIVLPFSPVGPTTSLLPLIFVVATTSIKQAYEDYLRHRMDRELNNRLCHVLRNQKLVKVRSKDIRVGDFVYVKNNEEIPCDMILLAAGGAGGGGGGGGHGPATGRISSPASGGHDKCYVTTANLDGETSLKSRSCFQILEQLGTIQQLEQTLLVVECERPNATLYEFSGNLRAPKNLKAYEMLMGAVAELTGSAASVTGSLRGTGKRTVIQGKKSQNFTKQNAGLFGLSGSAAEHQKLIAQTIMSQMSKYRSKAEDPNPLHQRPSSSSYHEIPLDITNILLRASRLRNTSFVYGLAVYTGRDTKLAQNSQVKPNKFSSTEATVNNFLLIAFMILMTFSLVGTIRYKLLFVPSDTKRQPEPFQEVFVAHFLLYNYLIPISLYVTLEFVKFFGTISVVEDKKMKAMVWRTIAAAPSVDSNTWKSRNENGGGLVGESSKMSVRSRQQRQSEKPKCNSSDLNEELGQVEVLFSDKTGTLTENSMQFKACSIRGSVYRSINEQLYQQPAELYHGPIFKVAHRMAQVKANRSALIGGGASHDGAGGAKSPLANGGNHHYQQHHSETSARDKAKAFDHRKFPPLEQLKLVDKMDQQQQERVVEFFICLCLCSTITINEQTPLEECLPNLVQGDYDYRSASPDEQSLIEAAHAFGVSMCKSNDRECFIVIEKSLAHRQKSKSKSKSPATTTSLQPKAGKFRALAEGKNSTDKYIVRHFERLLEFEFSSLRKRMSVIYRDCDNDCLLMVTKGSEELLDCLRIEPGVVQNEIDAILTHFEAFAKSGLRTLLVARRLLRSEEYDQIMGDLREAKLSIQNRDELTTSAYQKAENDLTLIGTTAVEDTLQDGVPETIANLKEAGIKVWLLTGDKVETAISVAYLCKLLDRDMTLFHLVRQQDMQACQRLLASFEHQLNQHHHHHHHDSTTADQQQHVSVSLTDLRRVKSQKSPLNRSKSPKSPGKPPKSAGSLTSLARAHSSSSRSKSKSKSSLGSPPPAQHQLSTSGSTKSRGDCKFALVADGRSLHYAMKYAKEELAKLCKQCSCVLGCRLSPLQKAEVVDMIKQSDESPITAAIGDGANDVSMIQEAHVGIGISGKEGKQAVNCSDFAIGRFQMLNRLFFVHGHLFYHRTANIIHYFFYKNFLFILPQFLYSCYNLSSTRSLYHPVLLIGFNLFFTSLPILVYGLLEVNIPEQALESCPKFYTANRANSQLRVSVFFAWLLLATIQGLLGFYLLQSTLSHLLEAGAGRLDCINAFAMILYFSIILTVTVRLYFAAYAHNLYLNLATLVSLVSLPGLLYAYSLVDLQSVISDNSLHRQMQLYFASPMFWFAIGTLTLITVLPDLLWLVRDRTQHLKWVRSTVRENHLAASR